MKCVTSPREPKPLPNAACPYCGALEVYFDHEQVSALDKSHRATTCDTHECGQCEWAIQNYQYETHHVRNNIESRGSDRGFRERIPEGYVLLVRPVDMGVQTEFEIVGRVEADAEVSDEHQAMMDSGEVEGYMGEFDATSPTTPTLRL